MTQGGSISPMISNVVVYVVLHNCVSLVVDLEGVLGQEGFGRDIHRMMAYLYVNNGIIA